MPEPNEYLVIRNLQSALRGISVAGGYFYDVYSAAVKLDPNAKVEDLVPPDGVRPFILIDVQPDAYTDFSSRPTRVKIDIPVHIYWVHDSDPTVDEDWLLTFYRGCADVEKAINADIQRGGLAFETRIASRAMANPTNSAQVWARVEAHILIGRGYGHPV